MDRNKWYLLIMIILMISIGILFCADAQAQDWIAIPPYNVLWPLWSPALSLIDPATGLATPLVTSLTSGTVLPVQPAIIWDPSSVEALHGPLPWLAYNIPLALGGGLVIWDQFYGLRPFPLDYMLDPITLNPLPIPLPLGYSLLNPIAYDHIWLYELMLGNTVYSSAYGVPITGLLTPQDIWGLPALGAPPLE